MPPPLTPAQLALVHAILEDVNLGRATDDDTRRALVRKASGGDEAVVAEVMSLLAQHDAIAADDFLERPAVVPGMSDATLPLTTKPGPGRGAPLPEIAGFAIQGVIESGGMGTVYRALQREPRRVVALKVMKEGIASRSVRRRFEFEAQTLARLRHPNVATIYEAGTYTPTGDEADTVPYFAMEYVPNAKTLIEYASAQDLSLRARLELFAVVCEAVHHGHQKGIIHRDLKPGNILVDPDGEPKVIDFGVARSIDSDMSLTTLQTDVGQLIGTVQYMSPEQCDADPHDLDTRSDVYALGVVLFELLCGRPPYDVSSVGLVEAVRVVRESVPPRPSVINRTLRGDVETIVLKSIEKKRERRYQSAAALAEDLYQWLRGEPIMARRPSALYVLSKLAGRHRAAVTVFAVVFMATILVLGAAVVTGAFALHAARVQRNADALVKLKAGEFAHAIVDRYLEKTVPVRLSDEAASPGEGIGPSRQARYREQRDRLSAVVEHLADLCELLERPGEAELWRSRLPRPVTDPEFQALIATHNQRVDRLTRLYLSGTLDCEWRRGTSEHIEPGIELKVWHEPGARLSAQGAKLGDVVFWLGADGEVFWFFDLSDDVRLHTGLLSDDLTLDGKSVSRFRADVLPELLGLVAIESDELVDPLVEVDWSDESLILGVDRGVRFTRMFFDPDTALPRRIEVFTSAGDLLFSSTLARYRAIDRAVDPDAPWMSTGIEMSSRDGEVRLAFAFDEMTVDQDDQPWNRVFDFERLRRAYPPRRIEGRLPEEAPAPPDASPE